MKTKEVLATLEVFAPLSLQDGYDNAGLQVGLAEAEISGVLLCLDVTEEIVDEAIRCGCNLVVAHHPLLFRPLKNVSDKTQVERCVRKAIKNDIAIYAAHTNLDNAQGGVSFEMAQRLGLTNVCFLQPNAQGGSGVVGELKEPMEANDFLNKVKEVFGVEALQTNMLLSRPISRVALCGGAGDFLIDEALSQKADAFLTGEIHYHSYFGLENQIQLAALGHYQSEFYTIDLLERVLKAAHPDLKTKKTSINTNPIKII